VRSALTFSPTAPVTVTVSATPAVAALMAEVNVSSCTDLTGGLRFSWRLNGDLVAGAGRVVLIGNLKPGDYNVSCTVSQYPTSEVIAVVSSI